ncbi:MAG TPA: N-acetyltransferase [Candidatus Fraserbacteria bacterium]|nr:N-acetyltransferase [Candidatus Fraserbacteria bacterium]
MSSLNNSPLEIRAVRTTEQQRQFIRLPWQLYRHDQNWVAPLLSQERERFDPKRNPFYQHAEVQLFLAYQAGQPVGRISAQIDHDHNEFWDEQTAFFGFFETLDDQVVGQALLGAAADWGRAADMKALRGPFNFNTNGECGLLVEGFSRPPCVMMTYNPSYYPELLESAGFTKIKDLLAYRLQIDENFLAKNEKLVVRLRALARRAERRGFKVRQINLHDFSTEVTRLRQIYNAAWERNWGFVPMSEAEFLAQGKELKQIAIPELALIAELDAEPVGFGLVIPDAYQALLPLRGRLFPWGIFRLLRGMRRVDGLRFITLGIKGGYRLRGVDALIYSQLIEATLALHRFRSCEFSWLLEDNELIIRACKMVGSRLDKTYRIYEKKL